MEYVIVILSTFASLSINSAKNPQIIQKFDMDSSVASLLQNDIIFFLPQQFHLTVVGAVACCRKRVEIDAVGKPGTREAGGEIPG